MHTEVGQVVSVRRVPSVATELIGSGIMEWSRERDRYLNVSEGAARASCQSLGLHIDAGSPQGWFLHFALRFAALGGARFALYSLYAMRIAQH